MYVGLPELFQLEDAFESCKNIPTLASLAQVFSPQNGDGFPVTVHSEHPISREGNEYFAQLKVTAGRNEVRILLPWNNSNGVCDSERDTPKVYSNAPIEEVKRVISYVSSRLKVVYLNRNN